MKIEPDKIRKSSAARAGIFATACLWSGNITLVMAAPFPPAPNITFQGQNVTNTTVDVVIGQQITLSADRKGTARSWVVSKKAETYGKFAHYEKPPRCEDFPKVSKQSCVVYDAADFSQPQTTFYVLNPGTYDVTYKYTASSGQSASSMTTFKVEGPKSVDVQFEVSTVQIFPPGCTTNCEMTFGTKLTPGIRMTTTATDPKGIPGSFLWSQQVGVAISFFKDGQNYTCQVETGLDNKFPSKEGAVMMDAPNIKLPSGQSEVSETFTAQTDLLWQASKSGYVLNPTPVNLGFVTWSWIGIAEKNPSGRGWHILSSMVSAPIYKSYGHATYVSGWISVLLNSYSPKCTVQ